MAQSLARVASTAGSRPISALGLKLALALALAALLARVLSIIG